MVNKTVISVNMECCKCKKVALNCVKGICGINSIEFNMKDKTMTVVGKADPVCMTKQLRRKFKCACLISHGPLPLPKKDPPKEEPPKKDPPKEGPPKKDPPPPKEEPPKKDPPPPCYCGWSPCSCRCKPPPPPPPPRSPCSCIWKPPPTPHPLPLRLPPSPCCCGWSPCSCRSENYVYDVCVENEGTPLCTIC